MSIIRNLLKREALQGSFLVHLLKYGKICDILRNKKVFSDDRINQLSGKLLFVGVLNGKCFNGCVGNAFMRSVR